MGNDVEVLTVDPLESALAHGGFAASAGTERALAEVLAEVVGVPRVSVDGHFFDDLGADSMVMARFCARVRKRADLPSVSMKDVYRHPTIRSLATVLADDAPVRVESSAPASVEVATPVGTLRYILCGTLQLLFLIAYPSLTAYLSLRGIEWVFVGADLVDIYLRSVVVGSAAFVCLSALPVLLKWVLVGRWKPREIRVWSLAYYRFWVVKTLIQRNPMALFVGSPLYAFYLRALGAKVGRGVAIFSRNVPVCTDLLSIGDGAVIRKDSLFSGYRAHDGVIQTGAVTIGKDGLVGDQTVLDIWASLGDGAQLGHSSSLQAGQSVPDGESWHGSPAQRADVDYRPVGGTRCGTARRFVFSLVQLLNLLVVGLPLAISGLIVLLAQFPQVTALLNPGPQALTSWAFYSYALVVSSVLFFGFAVVGLVFVFTVPRVLGLAIKPDRVYPLYGFYYWVHRTIARTTNNKFFAFLFGDSSYIVGYLRGLGYDLGQVEQTGSNFGQRVKHDSPYLSSVGRGTMVADGLSIINADFSSTSFRVSRVSIGANNFLGNNIAYPSQGRTGENCLLATKVMVPIDGPVREGVGLLGSPAFEIPRSVQRDIEFDLESGDELRRRLAAKNRHNLVTMGLFLFVRWFYLFAVTLIVSIAADLLYHLWGAAVVALVNIIVLLFGVGYWVLVERAVTRLQALRPMGCSIYDRAFWRHERFWKVPAQTYLQAFNGTPLKNVIWRMLGVRIGKRVFDDGCAFVEKTFVTIGDECTLNTGSIVQCHSQENGAFKSDRSAIGAGCTLGVGAFVHYGVRMGEGAVLAADSFLMKGEEVPSFAEWRGNPAREIRAGRSAVPAPRAPLPAPATAAPVPLRAGAVNGAPARRVRSGPSLLVAAALFPLGVATGMTLVSSVNPQVEMAFRPSMQAPGAPVSTVPVSPSQVPPSQTLPAPVAPVGEAVTSFRLADLAQLDRGLVAGDSGPLTVTVQQHLHRLGYFQGDANGSFDEPTSEAVRRFQAAVGVVEDPPGTVGRATAVALEAGGDRPEIAVGSRGDDVHRLQHALIMALGQPLQPNGTYGTTTAAAVRAYQSSRGLPVDGAVGARTWAALQAGR